MNLDQESVECLSTTIEVNKHDSRVIDGKVNLGKKTREKKNMKKKNKQINFTNKQTTELKVKARYRHT